MPGAVGCLASVPAAVFLMRFIHAADLHLDSPLRSIALREPELGRRLSLASRQVLTRIVDLALAERVQALVIAGDVFDRGEPDLSARAHLIAELTRLSRAGIPTVLVRGNHDALMDHARHGPLGSGIHLLDADRPTALIGDVAFHGVSFEDRHAKETSLPRYAAPDPARANVGIMHTSLDGSAGHDPYAPCASADLLAHGYDYWALGHIHRRAELRGGRTLAVMAGIPQGRHVREPGVGSVTLVTLDASGARAEERPVALIAFQAVSIDLSEATEQGLRAEAIETALQQAATVSCDVAVRLTLTGVGAAPLRDGPRAHLAPLVERVGGLWLEDVRIEDDMAGRTGPLMDELGSLMAEEAAKAGFRENAARRLAELREALPPGLRDALPDALLGDLLAEGLAEMQGRVRR